MEKRVEEYIEYLKREEKSAATQRQYRRDILQFLKFADGEELVRDQVLRYKEMLQETRRPATINTKLAALNGFFLFIGREDLRVKRLRVQRRPFCTREKELTKAEYLRLLETAKRKKDERLYLLMQTICGTGIRVSELKYVTVEAVRRGEAVIVLKGKTRIILISDRLRKALKGYIQRAGILSGSVFITQNGKPLDRSNIWKMMKALCRDAKVKRMKVFPHNLRRLFARCFYSAGHDIAKLSDVLGHSSLNTTRIYLMSSGYEHSRCMDSLGLVV